MNSENASLFRNILNDTENLVQPLTQDESRLALFESLVQSDQLLVEKIEKWEKKVSKFTENSKSEKRKLQLELFQEIIDLKKCIAFKPIIGKNAIDNNISDLKKNLHSNKKLEAVLKEELHQIKKFSSDLQSLKSSMGERQKQQAAMSRRGKKSIIHSAIIQEKERYEKESQELFTFLDGFLDEHAPSLLEGAQASIDKNRPGKNQPSLNFENISKKDLTEEFKQVIEVRLLNLLSWQFGDNLGTLDIY